MIDTLSIEENSTWKEFYNGIRSELPILLGVFPFGLIYGVLASGAGLNPSIAQAMSSIVFAGSSQFITVQLLSQSVPFGVILLTAIIVNLRHALYSASIAPYIQHLPMRWKCILAYLLTDEAYAVAITRYDAHSTQFSGEDNRHWFFLGAGLALWTCWQISTAIGIFVGAQVPAGWSLDFTLSLTFIALVFPNIKDKAGLVTAITAGIVSVLAAGLPLKLGLVVASVVGILVGMWTESK